MEPIYEINRRDTTNQVYWRILRSVANEYGVKVDVENCQWIGTEDSFRAEIVAETVWTLTGRPGID